MSANNKMHYFQKNLSIFKDTFQKPSQIYKYLGEIWRTNPIYLNRTLSYISKHRNRSIRNKKVSIDSICSSLLNKKKSSSLTIANATIMPQTKINSRKNHINCSPENKCDTSNNNSHSVLNKNYCIYNWICKDPARTSQKTKSYGFICAWCESNLYHLDSLMIHLKCCHSRFNFNLVQEDGNNVIEMTLNASFDGSYCGFKYPGHDLRRDFKFTPSLPERRTPTTQIIYFKAKTKPSYIYPQQAKSALRSSSIDMLNYDDGDVDIDVCLGRLYYHTSTCLPVKPNEVDIDSEADMDPDWLRERTQLMIDEFSDVNEGEKEILKLWNLHIMSNHKYKADKMIPQACIDFVETEGKIIIAKNLYKNFILHLANLYDYGLIGSKDMIECIRDINKLNRPNPTIANISSTKNPGKTTRSERNSNEHCQHSPAKRALLNSYYN